MFENLMEEIVLPEHVETALAAVTRNDGGPGVDGMTAQQLSDHLTRHWAAIRAKLLEGRYVPAPVRPVEIPKPSGGVRTLGIPTVLDRFIQHLLVQAMTPIFDPGFSNHSYGFRPGRKAQDAIDAAQRYARSGMTWVVDLDITKFFDHVNHDILMSRITPVIRDRRVLKLIGAYLRKGPLVNGRECKRREGTPQGGPLSPLLANIYLDVLDKELERRGHHFARYADDCNIYVHSQAAAERTRQSIQVWIEKHLRLEINAGKSGQGRVWERSFLGFRLTIKLAIGICPEKLERYKEEVRRHWANNQSRTSTQLRDRWNRYVRGWWGYFCHAEARGPLYQVEGFTRRHIRKCFWLRWHDGIRPVECRRCTSLGVKLPSA